MNHKLLYPLEQLLLAHLACFNSWQQANVALFSYGVISGGKLPARGNCTGGELWGASGKARRVDFGAG